MTVAGLWHCSCPAAPAQLEGPGHRGAAGAACPLSPSPYRVWGSGQLLNKTPGKSSFCTKPK